MNGNPASIFRLPVLSALALMVANDALGGPIRYGLASFGLVGLSYAPFLIAAAVVGAYSFAMLCLLRFDAVAITLLVLAVVWLPNALLLGLPPAQVAFGFYTWMPFFLGMAAIAVGGQAGALRIISWVWGLAVIGVLANAVFPFPWVGESYEILGVKTQFARDWQAFGIARLPGFSRASFTAANQILIGGSLLLAGRMARGPKAVVWLLSVVAIALTTSKAPLAAMLFAPLGLFLYDRLAGRVRFGFSQVVVAGLLCAAIGLPIAALLGLRLSDGGNLAFLSIGSVGVRMEMWPRVYALLDPPGTHLALGLGFGGIGAGQAYFDPARYNPGDNLFVFLLATFGVASLLFVAAFWRGNALLFRIAPSVHRDFFLIAMLVLILGAMANVVESVIPGFLLGMLAGKSVDPIQSVDPIAAVDGEVGARTPVLPTRERLVAPVRV